MTTLIKEEDSHSEILALPMLTVSHSTASMAEDDDLERDEVEEIEKGSAEINTKVYWSRLAVALGLTITGVAVTTWSYLALRAQETENFENAYAQFSRTVGQAAVEEMLRLREAARMFGHTVQATSELTNTTWPFYDYYDGIGVFAQEEVDAKQMESIQYLTRVQHSEREAYLDFQRQRYEQWVKEGHMQAYGHMDFLLDDPATYQDDILEFSTTDFTVNPSSDKEEYYPLAYRYPPPNSYFVVNFDISSINYDELFASMLHLKNQTLISNVNPYIEGDEAEKQYHAQFHDQLPDSKSDFPHSFLFHPIMKDAKSDEIIAVVTFPIAWDASLRRLLPSQVKGIIAVARNNCEQSVTYEIVGNEAFFLGWEDLHDTKYDDKEYVVNLDFSDHPEFEETKGHCVYSLSIYPSEQFEGAYKSSTPTLYVAVVGCTFALMILVFYVYDTLVQFRNRKIVREAARSNEIVTSMFPGALRDKIMNQKMAKGSSNKTWNKKSKQIAHALEHGDASMREMNISEDVAEPLAELHKQTTVFFGDIVGFTRWSSSREPPEIFHLLETIYRAFDVLARQRKIFKVETVGDCYVAVAGLPDPQRDHATRMCRFASHCLQSFSRVVQALEDALGADTAKLGLRIGIHSGSVTAGVLRGDRARFQLFGDTMNCTSRIETTGMGGKIHVSESTAKILQRDGFGGWIERRDDRVHAKGLGKIQTYWLKTSGGDSSPAPDKRTSLVFGDFSESHHSQPEESPRPVAPAKQRMSLVFSNTQKKLRLEEDIATTNEGDVSI